MAIDDLRFCADLLGGPNIARPVLEDWERAEIMYETFTTRMALSPGGRGALGPWPIPTWGELTTEERLAFATGIRRVMAREWGKIARFAMPRHQETVALMEADPG